MNAYHAAPSPSLDNVAKQVSKLTEHTQNKANAIFGSRSLPPLHKWQPSIETQMDLTIKSNGEWWHEGSIIPRASMIELFSSVLTYDMPDSNNQDKNNKSNKPRYYFKTPNQKIFITVEDAPLLVTMADKRVHNGQDWIVFCTNTQDMALLNDEHVPYFREYQGQMRPYVMIRDGLEALIGRNAYYHLVGMGELRQNKDNAQQVALCLNSGGQQYVISHTQV